MTKHRSKARSLSQLFSHGLRCHYIWVGQELGEGGVIDLHEKIFLIQCLGLVLSPHHYKSYNHFRRPEAAENKLFSAALGLFSVVPGRQKKIAENKAIFSAATGQPPKIAYFRRPLVRRRK
jgi:hypothetical protein